jgi:hypothetical protein
LYWSIKQKTLRKKKEDKKISAQWLNLDSAIWAMPRLLAPVFLSIGIIPTRLDLLNNGGFHKWEYPKNECFVRKSPYLFIYLFTVFETTRLWYTWYTWTWQIDDVNPTDCKLGQLGDPRTSVPLSQWFAYFYLRRVNVTNISKAGSRHVTAFSCQGRIYGYMIYIWYIIIYDICTLQTIRLPSLLVNLIWVAHACTSHAGTLSGHGTIGKWHMRWGAFFNIFQK